MVKTYNKLVRGKIPEIIRNNGQIPVTHIATDSEYTIQLDRKLIEEVKEYLDSRNPGELVDVLQVIYEICENEGMSREQIEKLTVKKAAERGKFLERIILERVE